MGKDVKKKRKKGKIIKEEENKKGGMIIKEGKQLENVIGKKTPTSVNLVVGNAITG